MSWFQSKPADPLTTAAAHQTNALNVFTKASNDLKTATVKYEEVKAAEQKRIADAQARHDAATAGQAKNNRIVAKLDDLLGTE